MSQKHGSATTPPEVDAGSRDDLTKANGKCPLCREYDIVSSHQYRSHVGHHLEQLALFVLPGAEEVEEQIEEEETGLSQSESHETEDEDQPTDDHEREQGVLLSGSPNPDATNDANNVLDAQQSDENSERFGGAGGFKLPRGSEDEFTSTFAEYAVSPSMYEGISTVSKHPSEILTENERKAKEEVAKLKYENEARLKLEKERLDAAGAKVSEEATKKEREELLKKIEEVEVKFRYEHEARLKLEERLDAEEAKKKEEASKKERADVLKKIEEIKLAEEVKKASGDDKEPIKFKDAVGRKFNFPWQLCATWTVCILSLPSCYAYSQCLVNLYLPRVWKNLLSKPFCMWRVLVHMSKQAITT